MHLTYCIVEVYLLAEGPWQLEGSQEYGLARARGGRNCKKRPGVLFFRNDLEAWTN